MEDPSQKDSRAPSTKVYVGKLSYKTQWMALKEVFGQAGTVTYAKILQDDGPYGKGSWSRGCGFVEFATAEEAAAAVQTLNGTELDGRAILVDLWDEAAPKYGPKGWSKGSGTAAGGNASKGAPRKYEDDDPACKVYIGNLSYKTKWGPLKDFMAQAGTVTYAKVLEDKGAGKGGFWSKGVGLAVFATPEEAAAAVASLNGQELDGRQVSVDHWT
mmetsp:Transcript_19776/g.35860  ORF Transcript_19776/g.35860 Transcript_19776/m.35860 type:complete len:215 (+) Transcript_19776:119-763(+)